MLLYFYVKLELSSFNQRANNYLNYRSSKLLTLCLIVDTLYSIISELFCYSNTVSYSDTLHAFITFHHQGPFLKYAWANKYVTNNGWILCQGARSGKTPSFRQIYRTAIPYLTYPVCHVVVVLLYHASSNSVFLYSPEVLWHLVAGYYMTCVSYWSCVSSCDHETSAVVVTLMIQSLLAFPWGSWPLWMLIQLQTPAGKRDRETIRFW